MNASSSINADQEPSSDYSKQLHAKEQIPETPFTALKFGDHWYLTMGKYRLTEALTRDAVIQEAYNTSWTRIMQIMQILIDENDNLKLQHAQERIQNEYGLKKTP